MGLEASCFQVSLRLHAYVHPGGDIFQPACHRLYSLHVYGYAYIDMIYV